MGIMADLYGLSTSDFLSKALNGELDNMKMKRLPTPVEMFRVHRALKRIARICEKQSWNPVLIMKDYQKLWMIWISNEKGHLRNQVSFLQSILYEFIQYI